MIKLGSKVRDKISGFEGIATGRTTWLYGCERICVQPQEISKGKPVDAQWFDVNQLDLIDANSMKPSRTHDPRPGGPQNDPSQSRSGE